ncbi:MAG: L-2-hydroxyglutarate oxidase [Cryomorphaceae bacterium]
MIASFDIAVVGGGIVGVATAYKLQLAYPDHSIAVIEKEKKLADHQTGNNSGVIHSGIYYKPGSYKARLCVEGRRELVRFAKENRVDHDICGKIVVATERSELGQLDAIHQRALDNAVEDVTLINADEIKQLEPFCSGIAGMHVGCTGIIDYRALTVRMAEILEGSHEKSKVFLDHEVTGVEKSEGSTLLQTQRGNIQAKYVVFCGGLQADRLALKAKVDLDMRVLGFRGDYYVLAEQGKHKVKNLIYPVPNPEFPFLGVHFTRMVDGDVECGPNAVFVFKREGYHKTDFSLKDTSDALLYSGTWKFFAKHWRYGLDEYRRAFSKQLFLNTLQKLIPSLEMDDLSEERAGVRAMALGDDGKMIDDFKIEYKDNCIHVLNAPSPAATACLAIGEEVRKMASGYFNLD